MHRASVLMLAAASAACGCLLSAPAAWGREASRVEVAALAARALHDPRALHELQQVDRVDGRPVDLAIALRGASPEQRKERLRALAAAAPDGRADAAADRERARTILSQARYKPPAIPRPFEGLLRRIARWLESLTRWLGEPFASYLPRTLGPWVPVAVAVVAAATFVAARAARRRIRGGPRGTDAPGARGEDDPRALERRAGQAERRGDLEEALRLRFRAGLLRLDAAGAIRFRPSISSAQVASTLRSQTFDALAGTFDEVVYGGRPARARDLEEARRGWSRLYAEVAR